VLFHAGADNGTIMTTEVCPTAKERVGGLARLGACAWVATILVGVAPRSVTWTSHGRW
jgi:hypothetical protein